MGLKAVHFGGGNIGRGFVAEKLSLSGYEVRIYFALADVIDCRVAVLLMPSPRSSLSMSWMT